VLGDIAFLDCQSNKEAPALRKIRKGKVSLRKSNRNLLLQRNKGTVMPDVTL
jgi:hypothetical protein